jgi:hypothetical protein
MNRQYQQGQSYQHLLGPVPMQNDQTEQAGHSGKLRNQMQYMVAAVGNGP